MRSFFKIFFATLLALVIFSVIGFFVLAGIAGSAFSDNKPEIGEKGVLVVDLSQHYPEQVSQSLQKFISGNKHEQSLYDVVRMIQYAKTDTHIKGIWLQIDGNANGYAASEEIRNALADFKQSGKFIAAYGDAVTERAYYIANVADKVYISPEGQFEWQGMSVSMYYLKGLLDKLEIEPQIFYAGQYKSATEPFRATSMSDANREQMNVLINDIYAKLLLTTAARTDQDTAELHALANNASVQTATDAKKYKLINDVKYEDQVKEEIRQWLKLKDSQKINFVSLEKYSDAEDYKKGATANRIAVIYAYGDIISGSSKEDGMIASDDMRELITKARNDKNVKAVVFRVNSPGGSALASDVIWREIVLTKKQKPVIVSMGDYAASGGYYISCAGDSIFTEANTLTGSIGVFSIIPNMQKFFNNKLGVTFDGVKTGPYADLITSDRPLTDAEKKMLTQQTLQTYNTFKGRVGNGRKKDTAYIETIAQGRVWTGKQAVKIGLADRIGGLQDAIDCAARMTNLKKYKIKEYPEQRSFMSQFFGSDTKAEVKQKMIKEEIGEENYRMYDLMKKMRLMTGKIQARLPFEAVIE